MVVCVSTALQIVALSVTEQKSAHAQSATEKLDSNKTVIIGIGNEPPWTEIKPDGSVTGVGPDIDKAILDEIGGKTYEGQVMDYGAMIPALQARRVTIVSSGALAIRPDRCQQVLFSQPVICTSQAFLARKELLGKLDTYKQVAKEGLRIAVCSGCVDEKYALEAGVKKENLVIFPDGVSAAKMLQDKRVDVVSLPDGAVNDLYKRMGDDNLAVIMPVTDVPIGCAAASFNKEDADLRDAYDVGLQRIVDSGEYLKLMTKYGLEANAKLLGIKTREELCTP